MDRRRVVIVVFDGVQSLDVTGPLEVFVGAARVRPGTYDVTLTSRDAGSVVTSSGVGLGVPRRLAEVRGPIDTLLVAGGDGVDAALADRRLVAAITRAAGQARRIASVCTGAFLLAEAGLLEGRRATTHWHSCARLAERYPAIDVDPEPIFVRDGNTWTSAGVTAGIDLALALVEDDLGADVSRLLARWLVVYLQRPGGQSQFSAPLRVASPTRPGLRDVLAWIAEHPETDCSVAALAARAGMSERTLARSFRAECGTTPAEHVEAVRLEAARRSLETSDLTIAAVAARSGFGTVETMFRAFQRRLRVTPNDYRRRFRAAPA